MKKFIFAAFIACFAGSAMAYSINGNSEDGFVLKCNDGTTNTSVVPPNNNAATEWCKDHGGVAPGYPRKIIKNQKAKTGVQAPAGGSGGNTSHSGSRAQDYNSSRSNNSSSKAQDYNSSRSNNINSKATDYNSSRSNTTSSSDE